MHAPKTDFIGLSRRELSEKLVEVGLDPVLVKQLWNDIYVKGATSFSQMSSISRKRQSLLSEHFAIGRPSVARELVSSDGTRKWLLNLSGQNGVESVLIPEKDRGALCVSSQLGCSLACPFCHTGTMKLVRNLTSSEIVAQVMNARDRLSEWGKKRRECFVTNIVLMGMGEPL